MPRPLVNALEVPVSGRAAQPGFAKMQPPREEKGAGARLDTAAQRGADAACQPTPGLEEGELLAVDAGSAHPNDGFLQLHVVGDAPDAAADHCGRRQGGVSACPPSLSLPPSPSPSPSHPTAASVTLMAAAQASPAQTGETRAACGTVALPAPSGDVLTKVTSANGHQDLGVVARPARSCKGQAQPVTTRHRGGSQ